MIESGDYFIPGAKGILKTAVCKVSKGFQE